VAKRRFAAPESGVKAHLDIGGIRSYKRLAQQFRMTR
jgi:hypothetical protein